MVSNWPTLKYILQFSFESVLFWYLSMCIIKIHLSAIFEEIWMINIQNEMKWYNVHKDIGDE